MTPLRLATRGSDLARTQSLLVANAIQAATRTTTELVIIETSGDQKTDVPLAEIGTIGAFTTEVQDAVLDGRADFAVHSQKDLPATQVEGLTCAAIPERADSADWLLVHEDHFINPDETDAPLPLKTGACIGTSAARRKAFLSAMLPESHSKLLRGNVPTRIQRLKDGDYDAILLAGAGLLRLKADLSGLQYVRLDPQTWPGAPGQGALAIECREDDHATIEILQTIHHAVSATTVHAERELLRLLGGGCGLPLGATASIVDGGIQLIAALGPTTGGDQQLRRADVLGTSSIQAAERAFATLTEPLLP